MKEIFAAIAFAVLLTAVPALAADTSTDSQPASSTSSGPGVKGAPGNKNGPVEKPNATGNTGSSSGTAGAGTQPSQARPSALEDLQPCSARGLFGNSPKSQFHGINSSDPPAVAFEPIETSSMQGTS
jgi:hypothetical protein